MSGAEVVVCPCHSELNFDDPDEPGVIETVDPSCPVHGPAGRGRHFEEITTTHDAGRRRFLHAEEVQSPKCPKCNSRRIFTREHGYRCWRCDDYGRPIPP